MALQYPFETAPAPGTTHEIAKGVRWLRMPLPMQLDHINLYLLEDDDGWYIVDTGVNTPEVKSHWETIFETCLEDKPVKGVIVTHLHPDHLGQANWLTERWQAPLIMSFNEYYMACSLFQNKSDNPSWQAHKFYRQTGLSVEASEEITVKLANNTASFEIPRSFTRLKEGDELCISGKIWRVLIGRGHSPEHICLYCDALGILISGDHILPRISPNISVWPREPNENPLGGYLETLPRFSRLPLSTLVLPAHNLPFRGVSERVRKLMQHHKQKLRSLEEACVEPKNTLDLMPVMFKRELDGFQFLMALGECQAHLTYLVENNRLQAKEHDDNVIYFSLPKDSPIIAENINNLDDEDLAY